MTLTLPVLSFVNLLKPSVKLIIGESDYLKCTITAITDSQNFTLPVYPRDDFNQGGDTSIREPRVISVRAYVKGENVVNFENTLLINQMNTTLFTITNLNNITYNKSKIKGWTRETNANMLGAYYYNITFQEIILVTALTSNIPAPRNKAVSGKSNGGGQTPDPTPKSTAKDLLDRFSK